MFGYLLSIAFAKTSARCFGSPTPFDPGVIIGCFGLVKKFFGKVLRNCIALKCFKLALGGLGGNKLDLGLRTNFLFGGCLFKKFKNFFNSVLVYIFSLYYPTIIISIKLSSITIISSSGLGENLVFGKKNISLNVFKK